MTDLHEAGEWGAIARLAAQLGPAPAGEIGLGDDAAAGRIAPGCLALTTVDLLVEGVHFRTHTTPPEALGHKALAVSLSDIAAMGGKARWAVVGLALPPTTTLAWVEALYAGMAALAHAHGVTIAGGDTVRAAGGIVLSMTVVGEAATPLLRSDARPGDVVFMTGPAGLAAAGLWCLEHGQHDEAAIAAHRRPQPQLAAGQGLAALNTRIALIDNSDGLGRSAQALAEASGVDLVLWPEAFPCETATTRVAALAGIAAERWVLGGGEDYGLVGCVSVAGWPGVVAALSSAGAPATRVGEVRPGTGRAWVRGSDGALDAPADAGFGHFG
ncbi:MAG: thiL [Cyanobacteria bacterium RYN_339]|nr:thiL [Cyanobacteria bacterium RYN_339]